MEYPEIAIQGLINTLNDDQEAYTWLAQSEWKELATFSDIICCQNTKALEFLIANKDKFSTIVNFLAALQKEDKAFDFIVASGVRGALPHGRASEKLIGCGELVTIDFGAVCNGYYSDETVTLAVGKPDDRQKEIYSIVRDAHDMALASVMPGITFKELDAKARSFIERKGYGCYFGHGLGHGIGLEVHEQPTVSFRSDGVVEEGMVFTVEPGIYIPGWGGVRIEDSVCVTADGYRCLTKVPKEMMII